MDQWSEQHSAIDYSYSFRGDGSINHPSVDNLSSYSLISDINNNSHHYNLSRSSFTVEKSKRSKKGKQQRLDQRPRASSQPIVDTNFTEGTHGNSRSFESEPLPSIKRGYANNSLSTFENSRSASSLLSDHHSKRFEDVFSDSPSETRLRIEKSLSNIREQQARSISRPSTLSKSSEFYDDDINDDDINGDEANDMNKHQAYHENESTSSVSNTYRLPKEGKGTRNRKVIRKMSQPELNANYHAWETNFQKKTMDAMDERYKQVTASLETRIKLLEEEIQKANEDMESSREYVSQIQEKSNRIDYGTQTVEEKIDLIDYGTQTSMRSIQEKLDLIDYGTQTSIRSIEEKPDIIDYGTQTSMHSVQEKPDLIDNGTQTSIQGVRQISDLEVKSKKIKAIETMLNDLGFDTMDDFEKVVKDWKTKAHLFDQVQCFIDRVDDVVWDTPYVSLLSICQQHKNVVSSMRNSPNDICETHRTQYEKALLEAERDKNRASGSRPYSSEHLDVTFERLVRWAHTVRHVTS